MMGVVKTHINSFPKMESHYCRKSTKRQYLASNLNITRMYELYKDQQKSKNKLFVRQAVYRTIFLTEFNLGFHIPKKDQCKLCTKFENLQHPTSEEIKEHIPSIGN